MADRTFPLEIMGVLFEESPEGENQHYDQDRSQKDSEISHINDPIVQ